MTDTPATPNPAPTPQADQTAPRIRIMSQYIRDLSFENPTNAGSIQSMNSKLDIDVSAIPHQDGNGIFEVLLKMRAEAFDGDSTLFICELHYGSMVQLQNIPAEEANQMLLIEVPRQLFPFARRIIADITREGGFPPLYIDPIDFVGIYRAQADRAAT